METSREKYSAMKDVYETLSDVHIVKAQFCSKTGSRKGIIESVSRDLNPNHVERGTRPCKLRP